jgi:hypothetical protein
MRHRPLEQRLAHAAPPRDSGEPGLKQFEQQEPMSVGGQDARIQRLN